MSISEKQMIANQLNALLSTGPTTAAGKAASSGNARKHNIFSKDKLINGETQEEYDEFEAELLAELNPETPMEWILAEKCVCTAWRMRRLNAYEVHVITTLPQGEKLTDEILKLSLYDMRMTNNLLKFKRALRELKAERAQEQIYLQRLEAAEKRREAIAAQREQAQMQQTAGEPSAASPTQTQPPEPYPAPTQTEATPPTEEESLVPYALFSKPPAAKPNRTPNGFVFSSPNILIPQASPPPSHPASSRASTPN